jgi:5-methylcytosine-specific restriction endonuclease McrA
MNKTWDRGKESRDRIRELYSSGMKRVDIARELRCSRSTITRHLHSDDKLKEIALRKKERLASDPEYRIKHYIHKKINNFKNFEKNNASRKNKHKEDFKENYDSIAKDEKALAIRIRASINKFRFNKKKGKNTGYINMTQYGYKEVMEKIGIKEDALDRICELAEKESPKCYLTGRTINLQDTKSWNLDHITPKSRGGTGNLDNMEIACKDANQAKGSLTVEETLNLCKEILEHHGYNIVSSNVGRSDG